MIPVLAGDGIGPAVVAQAVAALRAVGFDRPTLDLPFGLGAWERTGLVRLGRARLWLLDRERMSLIAAGAAE